MKTISLLMFTLTCFFLNAAAQTVFAPVGAKWYYSGAFNDDEPDTSWSYILLQSEKDTVFGGETWREISMTSVISYYGPSSPHYYDTIQHDPVFVFASGDTVLYYNEHAARATPLYIFNVHAGDTLRYHVPDTFCAVPEDSVFRVVADSVLTMNVGGKHLQRIRTSSVDQYWTLNDYAERIGNLHHFLTAHNCLLSFPEYHFPQLRCYSDDSVNYQAGALPCDYLPSSVREITDPEKTFSVYPNPADAEIHIGVQPFAFDLTVKLYDASGMLRRTTVCPSGTGCDMSLMGLAPGLYWLTGGNGKHGLFIVQKVLKQ